MSYFAKKIDYCANQTSFVALIKIARKKGGKPIKFILYRYAMDYGAEIIELGDDENKAKKSFPYGPVVFEELLDDDMEDDSSWLPKERKNLWQKTTDWLYEVAVGGGYKIHPDGNWIKVGRPAQWNRHRKKFRLKFGELGHILLVFKQRIRSLEQEKDFILTELDCLDGQPIDGEYEGEKLTPAEIRKIEQLEEQLEEVEDELTNEFNRTRGLIKEMKVKRKENYKGGV